MISQIRSFFVSQKHFSVIFCAFFVYLAIFLFNRLFPNNFILETLQLVGGLFFMILGSGISIVLIIQAIFKKKFDQWEALSLSFLFGIIFFPLILTLEYVILRRISFWYPLANILFFLIGAGVLLFLKKTSFPQFSLSSRPIVKHPVFIVLLVGTAFTLFQIFSYRALPDLDPYKWLFKYTYQFANSQLDYSERPLFGSFVFIGTTLSGLNIFIFFKYIFPFIFFTSLFPAWMIARFFNEAKKQWLFLLFLFASPVVILYSQTSIPQTILITISYFFVFLLLYSQIKKDDFFFYLSGISIFLAFFFHQAAFIVFAVWTLIAIIAKRKELFSDKKTSFLILLLLATNLSRFKTVFNFGYSWISTIIAFVARGKNFNFLYPAQYTNIDTSQMGWGSFAGVVKFYSFYMGPVLGGLFILLLLMLIFSPAFRSFFAKNNLKNFPSLIILLSFLSFFTIAEIFPRFLNVSLLPDRAWIFCGIFSVIFLFIIFDFIKKIPFWSMAVFTMLFLAVISGAIYVNYSKNYLITSGQWKSAEWIKKNLPENRVFLSYGYKNLLPVHADSAVIKISPEIYCKENISDFQSVLNDDKPTPKIFVKEYYDFLENTKNEIENKFIQSYTSNKNIIEEYSGTIVKTNGLLSEISGLQKTLNKKESVSIIPPLSHTPILDLPIPIENIYRYNTISSLKENSVYIYYSKEHPKSPYRSRSYEITTWGIDPCPDGKFLFDLYPEKFKRVYAPEDGEVIIWQVL